MKKGGYEGEKVNPLLCICIHVPFENYCLSETT